MPALPPNFVDVTTARSKSCRVNVTGVVVDVLPKKQTHGSSALTTFTIMDSSFQVGYRDGLKVKYFNDDLNFLPDVQVGDVIQLDDIRVRPYKGEFIGVVAQNETVRYAIFRDGREPSPLCGPISWEPNSLQIRYAEELLRCASEDSNFRMQIPRPYQQHRNQQGQQAQQGQKKQRMQQDQQEQPGQEEPPARPVSVEHTVTEQTKKAGRFPFVLIKDTQPKTYVTLMGEIVKIFTNDSEKCTIFITDYSSRKPLLDKEENDDGSRLGDQFGHLDSFRKKSSGFEEQETLQVTLWQPHAGLVLNKYRERDLVLLTNVHIRTARNNNQVLEAVLHGDRRYPDKVNVHKVNEEEDGRARDLLQRKREYLKKFRALREPRDEPSGPKKKQKKTTKQQKKQEAKKEEGQKELSVVVPNPHKPNPSIKCWHIDDVRPLPLEDILTNNSHSTVSLHNINYRLPFQNVNYRSIVKVVDFFPSKLEDFSVPISPGYVPLGHSESQVEEQTARWEWRFCLFVRSAMPLPQTQPRETVKLFVSGEDAVHLLQIDPTDLRQDQTRLEELREKLFIVWGNLEELKQESKTQPSVMGEENNKDNSINLERLSSLPFTCCIQEYGIECSHEQDKQRRRRHSNNDGNGNELDINTKEGIKARLKELRDCGRPGCLGWERRFSMIGTSIMS